MLRTAIAILAVLTPAACAADGPLIDSMDMNNFAAPKAKGMAPGLKRWLQAAESTSGGSASGASTSTR